MFSAKSREKLVRRGQVFREWWLRLTIFFQTTRSWASCFFFRGVDVGVRCLVDILQMFWCSKWTVHMYILNFIHPLYFTDTYKSPISPLTLTRNPGIYIFALSLNPPKINLQVLLPLEIPCFWHTLAHCTMAKSWESKGTPQNATPLPGRSRPPWGTINHHDLGGGYPKDSHDDTPLRGAFSFTFAFVAFALSIPIALGSFTTLSTLTMASFLPKVSKRRSVWEAWTCKIGKKLYYHNSPYVSSVQNRAWLGYIRDYTTQLYRDCNKPF